MRILAVEDEPLYREMLQEVIRSLGHSITVAADGTEALKILEAETMDVIVSDVSMPGMNGLEFHRMVRAKPAYAKTPFVFLTGITDISQVKAACQPECDLLLQKPFPVDALLRLFSRQLNSTPGKK